MATTQFASLEKNLSRMVDDTRRHILGFQESQVEGLREYVDAAVSEMKMQGYRPSEVRAVRQALGAWLETQEAVLEAIRDSWSVKVNVKS